AQTIVIPTRLPADFVIVQRVRRIGSHTGDIRAAIDAARPETRGIGGIHHVVVVDLPGQIDLVRFAGLLHAGVEVGAWTVINRRRTEAQRLARSARIPDRAETEEALQ